MPLLLNNKELGLSFVTFNSLRIEYFIRSDQSTVNFH